MTLEVLREEYQAARIGPRIWGLVYEMTGRIARSYPPAVYNDGAMWSDDSVEDLAQQVVLDRLLGEAQLEYIFDQAMSMESWRRLMTFQIRRTLSHRRRKTVVDRLLARVRKLAQTDPFRLHAAGRSIWISHREREVSLVDLDDSRITYVADSVRHIPQLIASPRSSRASMIYTTADLRSLLELVVEEVGAVSERDLARILEVLLTSWLPTFLQTPERDFSSDEPTPEEMAEDAEMGTAIRAFADGLSDTERWILLGKSQGIADGEIAARLGRSRPWVAERKHRVLDRLGTELGSWFDEDRRLLAMESLLGLISAALEDTTE